MKKSRNFRIIVTIIAIFVLIIAVFQLTQLHNNSSNQQSTQTSNIRIAEEMFIEGSSVRLFVSDLNEPIPISFHQTNRDRNVLLKVYLDYEEIYFSINSKGKYNTSHMFFSKNNEEQILYIYLNKNVEIDDYNHKLLISFNYEPNMLASSFEATSEEYGANVIYDLCFNKNINENIYRYIDKKAKKPKETPDYEYSSFILNMNNDVEQDLDDGILLPKNLIKHISQKDMEITYDIAIQDDEDYEELEVLIILNIQFEQTDINEKSFEVIKVYKNKLSRGSIYVKPPINKGQYEITAYMIANPFSKTENNLNRSVKTSPRFTIEILEIETSDNSSKSSVEDEEEKDKYSKGVYSRFFAGGGKDPLARIMAGNPIDPYWENEDSKAGTTKEIVEFLYGQQNAWKEEMEHVYQLLYEIESVENKVLLEESQKAYITYVNSTVDYVSEMAETGGTIDQLFYPSMKGSFYRKRTIELIDCYVNITREYTFIFDDSI